MDSIVRLQEKLEEEKPEVRLLVHDAGVCIGGSFESMPLEKALSMIDLNCKGAVAITRVCLPYIVDGGTIVEVSSTSAFVPNTGMVLYGATKSLVYEMCIGCGLCARKCPIQAIEIQDKKPVWVKKKCALCFRCLHHCPKFAIQYGNGKTKLHGQYRNPHVKV